MIGKFAKKATKAGGVTFSISSKALVVWPPTAAITGFDKVLAPGRTPATPKDRNIKNSKGRRISH